MSPSSSPEQSVERMGLLLSISTNQIVTCSNRAGSINLFSCSTFQTKDAHLLFDVARDRVQGKVLTLRSRRMVGMFFKFNQPELWLLTAKVKVFTVLK